MKDLFFLLKGQKTEKIKCYSKEFSKIQKHKRMGLKISDERRNRKIYGFPLIRVMLEEYEEKGRFLTLKQSFQRCIRQISLAARGLRG
ncbi:hypothetical protein DXT76_11380 [Halobacillus trueperi]|uniref:Uncharacterized protein n=2 Tax=Halobacillus TaxID=45667 RepID=A0A1H0JXT1_HALAD|nr:hypothetical protein DXT76_11380 [Halobacillus trueperi]SDO48457.1 hypothetical protein SAMN05421677_105163 [Halobacillus aidingensis]